MVTKTKYKQKGGTDYGGICNLSNISGIRYELHKR